jgi:hypothetical protein
MNLNSGSSELLVAGHESLPVLWRRVDESDFREAVPMVTMFVQHPVNDYEAWRKVYESVADLQSQGGVIDKAVYRLKDDPNTILVMHTFSSAAEAQAFAQNGDLKAAMDKAGVAAPPRFEIYDEA